MTDVVIQTAFAHSSWATLRVLEACRGLTAEQIETPVAGGYGSILETLRHLVGGEAFSLCVLDDDAAPPPETDAMSIEQLREVAMATGAGWQEYLAKGPNPAQVRREVDEGDGFTRDAGIAFRLVQELQHASEHRTQVCTGLTVLGIAPPKVDVYTYGVGLGLVREWMPGDKVD